MKTKLLLVAILFSCFSWGQLLQWNTFANTGNETTEPSVLNDINISPSNLTQGTITAALNGNRFGGSGWFNTGNTAVGNTLNEAISGNDYIQFIVTPNSGFSFTPTSFVFRWDRSVTGPSIITLRSSIDNFTSDLGTVANMVSGGVATTTDRTITISGLTNVLTATTFRIYGYGSTAVTGTGGFDNATSVVNVALNGTTASTVSTPTLTITGTPTNHGNVCTTTSGTTIQYTITNSGTIAASGVTAVSNDPQFVVSGLSSTTITASGGTATYNVTFTPTTAGAQNAIISVSSSTVGSNAPTINLTGTGITPVTPTITTNVSTNVLSSTATINGTNVLGVCPSTTVRGFVYAPTATNSNPQVGGSGVIVNNSSIGAGNFLANLSGLMPTTQYSFVAYVFDGTTYTYGSVLTFTTTVLTSNSSDIVSIGTSESPTISSLINDNAPLTSVTGAQVWQFKVRDGGATLNDADTFPTILTDFTILQNAGNTVGNWSDGINTIALFDGTTFIATGTVTGTTIVFSGLNISVADNTEKTLSLRLSLKCSLGANAFDGEDFVFSISNVNVTFSATGSTKSAFGAQTSANGSNVISVVATKLTFTAQPSSAGINAAMTNVVLTATDACNNKDLSFTGTVALTSTGTMTGSPINIAAVAGIATFANIIHTAIGTGLTLTATSTGITEITSTTFDVLAVTFLTRGDLAILAVNVNTTNGGAGSDEIVFVCFQDILVGTTLYLTDNGYERQFDGKWGSTEGVISITRAGSTLHKGTIIVFRANTPNVTTTSSFDIYSCGIVDTNWTKGIVPISGASGFNLNSNDDIWITQGGTWTDSGTAQNVSYDGNVLYGWTESGWNTVPGGINQSTQWSTLFPSTECYVTLAPTGDGFVKFNQPVAPGFATSLSRLDWISLINNNLNWTTYVDNTTYVAGGYNYYLPTPCLNFSIIGDTYINGKWTGARNTNWFDCANWDTLVVPDATVDVQVGDNTFNRQAIISATAQFANDYGNIAKAKNLTITGEKVEIVANINNKLEVNGNVLIDAPAGALDMDDSTIAADGQLTLTGNWTNNIGNNAFEEGNGTVIFNGTTPQIINNITPEGTEVFYNLILNNSFDTSVSNDLIATGNLTLATGKILTIPSNDYVSINKVLANNGTINVANNASLVQTENGFTNTGSGTTNVKRDTTPYQKYDYTYWSSPIQNNTIGSSFSAWRQNFTFEYDTTKFSDLFSGVGFPQTIAGSDTFDDNDDDWVIVPQSTTMIPGRGYAIMENQATHPATTSILFSGAPNNGLVTAALKFSANAADTTDDLNFVGNPYPSAVSANDFINANLPNISGTLYFWTHKDDVNTINPGPDTFNFTNDDYAYYNLTGGIATNATVGTGSNTGSNAPSGFIASGQGFFVEAQNEVDLIFSNAMRAKTYSNTNFFRNANLNNNQIDRIWLNLTNTDGMFSQQLIGYFDNATLENDQAYDAQMLKGPSNINFYSQSQSQFYKIQARPAFNSNDTVLIGFTTTANGDFSIAIDNKEGVFETQNIYLQDNLLNIVHDLKQAPYNFVTTYGTFDDRFVLKYENSVLSNNTFVNAENQVNISAKDSKINIVSNTQNIKQIEVFDVLGRRLFNNDLVNEKTFTTTSILAKNQTLIVKIKLENGEIITRKIII